MSPSSWQGQNRCWRSLVFIKDWRVTFSFVLVECFNKKRGNRCLTSMPYIKNAGVVKPLTTTTLAPPTTTTTTASTTTSTTTPWSRSGVTSWQFIKIDHVDHQNQNSVEDQQYFKASTTTKSSSSSLDASKTNRMDVKRSTTTAPPRKSYFVTAKWVEVTKRPSRYGHLTNYFHFTFPQQLNFTHNIGFNGPFIGTGKAVRDSLVPNKVKMNNLH